MKKRLTAVLLLAAAACLLCGCGRIFYTEYEVETSFEPVVNAAPEQGDDATVASLADLKDVLRDMVTEGDVSRVIHFDPGYLGDVAADLSDACWQIRTQDALCAYCVENISYEVSKIVNRYEARLLILYRETGEPRENIAQLPYAADAAELLRGTMEAGRRSLVLLIEHSSYTAEAMEDFIQQIYRADPVISPREPGLLVNMISGADTQRLYVIDFDYGMEEAERAARRDEMAALELFPETDPEGLSEAERALLACCALIVRSAYTEDGSRDSICDALLGREADDRGLALAYVEYCRRLGLDCQIVLGQRGGEPYCWNIVQLDGAFYHVDTAVCSRQGVEAGFLLDDESAWGAYRWDYFAYPHCTGTLRYAEVASAAREYAPAHTVRGESISAETEKIP